jgi:hypothetical protein
MSKMKRTKVLIALIAVVALAAGQYGCGSGGDTGTAAEGPPLTKSQFISKADAICRAALKGKDEKVRAAAEEEGGNGSPQELAKLVEGVVLPIYQETVAELKNLNPPGEDEAVIGKMMDEYEAGLQQAEANPVEAVTGNPLAQADAAAENYGLEYCRF